MRIKYISNADPRVQIFDELVREKFPHLLNESNPELYLVAGGDGAMLHAIQKTIEEDAKYLGKALGTVNFLMNLIKDDSRFLDDLISDRLRPYYFETYSIDAYLNGKKIGEAVNDVILGDKINDYITYEISSEEGDFQNMVVKGGGICISTAIGSTAFNFNNGGRIIPLNSCLLSITGIVCNRYLNDIIPFQELRIQANKGKIFLSNVYSGDFSGKNELILKKGTKIKIGFLNKEEFLERRIKYSHRYRSE